MTLSPLDQRILRAAAETVFPPGGAIEADGNEADIVAYLDDYLARLPRFDRWQLIAFFRFFDVGLAWVTKRPGDRFHTADPVTRREYVESWDNSPSYLRRMGFQGLRMVLMLAYVESQSVQDAMGVPRAQQPNQQLDAELAKLGGLARQVVVEGR